jgi:hypothetical protein
LRFEHFKTGHYEAKHPFFPGLLFLELKGSFRDKTRKLSVSHGTLLEDAKARRVAHNPRDILSPFGRFQILCTAAHPDQEFIYHYKVPKDKSLRRQLDGFGFNKILLDAGG